MCVFTFWFTCCNVSYDFRIKMMFASSLSPVVCSRVHVLFMLFVFACALWCPTHIMLCVLLCFSSSSVPHVACFSGLSIFDCPFDILSRLFKKQLWVTSIYTPTHRESSAIFTINMTVKYSDFHVKKVPFHMYTLYTRNYYCASDNDWHSVGY